MDQNEVSPNSANVLQVIKIIPIEEGSANFFCKGTGSKYVTLSGPDMISVARTS